MNNDNLLATARCMPVRKKKHVVHIRVSGTMPNRYHPGNGVTAAKINRQWPASLRVAPVVTKLCVSARKAVITASPQMGTSAITEEWKTLSSRLLGVIVDNGSSEAKAARTVARIPGYTISEVELVFSNH